MTETKQIKQVALQARVDEEFAQVVEIAATVQGLSVSGLIRKALDDYLRHANLDDEAIATLERMHQEKLAALDKLREWQEQLTAYK